MKHSVFFLLFLLFFFPFPDLRGEIYDLWPFAKGAGNLSPAGETLPSKKFWKEPIRVNGTSMQMDVSLLDMRLTDAVAVLKKTFPEAKFAHNSNSILFTQEQKNGRIRRIYLVALPGVDPVLQFTMEIPAEGRAAKASDWPKEIPLLSGAKNISVMSFPNRKSDWASCYLPGMTKPQLVSEMSLRLKKEGWEPAAGEIADPFRSTGDVFFKEKPFRILLLSVAQQKEGVLLNIYTRPVK